jgi:hypothetical protein
MRRTPCGLLAATALVLITAAALGECPEGFTPIFNGKDLNNWKGLPGYWSVEDGCLTGATTPERPLTRSTYLFWQGGKLADFELRATYRFVGSFGNSGINFRSQPLPDGDIKGYQGDMETGSTYTGILFDVKRPSSVREWKRQILTQQGQRVVIAEDGTQEATTLAPAKQLQQLVKPNEWNEYVIVARGPEIILKVNGAVFSHVIDREKRDLPDEGLLALQLHRGPPMKVQFKSICIKRLPPPDKR